MTGDIPTQDALDGAALRRLREALPEEPSYPDNWRVIVEDDPHDRQDRRAVSASVLDRDDKEQAYAYGSTIAEAADKCREALA